MQSRSDAPVDRLTGGGYGVLGRRTLAIVGSHPAGLDQVPWDDPEVEIWIFNEAPLKPEKYPRYDASLQLHKPEVYANPHNWVNSDYWDWLQQPHGKPVWMQEVDPRVPDSVRYPIEAVRAMIPWPYLRSSPALALALAIHLGYERILLYGSELTSNTEYSYQASNYTFWIGFALGRGIDLQVNCWQSEFNQPVYGYDGELQLAPEYFEERVKMLDEAWQTNRRALEKAQNRINEALMAGEFAKFGKLSREIDLVAMAEGEARGALSEARRYAGRTSPISRQEFERVAAHAQQGGEKAQQEKFHKDGTVEYVWNLWAQTGKYEARTQLQTFHRQKIEAAQSTGELLGVFRENIHYMNEYDRRLQAAGGVRALGRPS